MSLGSFATQNTDITAVLKDNTNNLIGGATLTFLYKLPTDLNFTTIGNATTNGSGSATVTFALPAPDQVILDVRFNGTSMYSASTGEITYNTTVGTPAQTQLTLSVSTPVISGNTAMVTVTGNLTLTTGGGVSGQVINVALDGGAVGDSNPTNANGAFSFQITNIPFGNHVVMASYMGNASFAASSQNSSFSVGGGVSGVDPFLLVEIAGLGAVAVTAYVLYMQRRKR